jgi:hypothetical protein
VIISADKKDTVEVEPPWAVDTNGRSVPTHFEVRGAALVQVVDHHTGDFAYPIVADPKYKRRWFGTGGELVFNIRETRRGAQSGGAIAGMLGGCAGIPGGPAICAPLAAVLGVASGYFALMDDANKCAKFYHVGPPLPGNFTAAPGGQKRGDFGCN